MSATKKLLQSLFQEQSHYFLCLPNNLNWALNPKPWLMSFLRSYPITVWDVGARGGLTSELESLKGYISLHAFEADPEECNRLNSDKEKGGLYARHVYPYLVAEKCGPKLFHIFKEPAHSSSRKPSTRFQESFSGPSFDIDKTLELEAITLDDLGQRESLSPPDFLKLDTQGTELDILRASERVLDETLLLEVEVEFTEMYQGQALFHEVASFLYERNFELVFLNRVFGCRRKFTGTSRGQVVFGDAVFARREDALERFSSERVLKYIILLLHLGHVDFAYDVVTQNPEIQKRWPEITQMFQVPRVGRVHRLKSFSVHFLDKVIALLLHLRRTNRLFYDSDRSYPTR